MTLVEQVYTHARLMAQELAEENQPMLEAVCAASVNELKQRLRDNIGPEDCLTDFVTAAAMLALSSMSGLGSMAQLEQVSAGDFTVRRTDGENIAVCLRQQAEMLMRPYVKAPFLFAGV